MKIYHNYYESQVIYTWNTEKSNMQLTTKTEDDDADEQQCCLMSNTARFLDSWTWAGTMLGAV